MIQICSLLDFQIGTHMTVSKSGTQEFGGPEKAVSISFSVFTTAILGVQQLWTNPAGAF